MTNAKPIIVPKTHAYSAEWRLKNEKFNDDATIAKVLLWHELKQQLAETLEHTFEATVNHSGIGMVAHRAWFGELVQLTGNAMQCNPSKATLLHM